MNPFKLLRLWLDSRRESEEVRQQVDAAIDVYEEKTEKLVERVLALDPGWQVPTRYSSQR